jgi:hypothetical protein
MSTPPTASASIVARAEDIKARLARIAAERVDVEIEIDKLALADQPINGHLHRRDEIDVRLRSWEAERRRLLDEELPAAKAREASAERKRRIDAARKHHASMLKAAAEVDAALAKATAAVARAQAAEDAMLAELPSEMRPTRVDWQSSLTRAIWASRATAPRWAAWRGPPTNRPVLGEALALPRAFAHHAASLAAQVARLAPVRDADPLEMRPEKRPLRDRSLPDNTVPEGIKREAAEVQRVASLRFPVPLVDNKDARTGDEHRPDRLAIDPRRAAAKAAKRAARAR